MFLANVTESVLVHVMFVQRVLVIKGLESTEVTSGMVFPIMETDSFMGVKFLFKHEDWFMF